MRTKREATVSTQLHYTAEEERSLVEIILVVVVEWVATFRCASPQLRDVLIAGEYLRILGYVSVLVMQPCQGVKTRVTRGTG